VSQSTVTVSGETIPLWSVRGVQYWPAAAVWLFVAIIVLFAAFIRLMARALVNQ